MNTWSIRVKVVKNCNGISPWIRGMEVFVNDGVIYHAERNFAGSYHLKEIGLYFPPDAIKGVDGIDSLISSTLIKTNWTRKQKGDGL